MRLQIVCQWFGQVFIGAEKDIALGLPQDLCDVCSERRELPALLHGDFGDVKVRVVIDLVGDCTSSALRPAPEKSRVLQTAVVCVNFRSGVEQDSLTLPVAEFRRGDMEDAEAVGLAEKEGLAFIHICWPGEKRLLGSMMRCVMSWVLSI